MDVAQLQELVQTVNSPSGAQLFTVLFCGILSVVGLIWVMWFIIGIRFRAVDKLEERMEKLQEVLSDISSKMWTDSMLDTMMEAKISKAIREHENTHHTSKENRN